MSVRRGNEDLLYVIRTLQQRVDALETHGERTRRNDVRIGNMLLSWDDATNQVTMSNLKTGGPPVTIHVP